MLRNTFLHLPGIGPRREQDLWKAGIGDWDVFLTAEAAGGLPGWVAADAIATLRQSREALARLDARFFRSLLTSSETWRLYSDFADQAVFLDIETTGLSPDMSEVTVVGALSGGRMIQFIQGVNLDEFPDYIARFPLLVTFNGSQFDVPFLRAHFPAARLDQAHIDLRFVLASLGYRGGLKAVERTLGLRREAAIEGVDGFEAVPLWRQYRRGSRAALERLTLYNRADVENMVELVNIAVRLKRSALGFTDQRENVGHGESR
jgi:uncharacterized protein